MSEAVNTGLFHNFRVCAVCGRRLPEAYDEELCPSCKNEQLLHEVKDFIRANDVNEYQVAGHFNIPVSTVKNWIREGRIEYRTKENGGCFSMHCQRCGAPVTFGTLCPKCLKLLNGAGKGYGITQNSSSDERMRFIRHDD